MTKIAGIKYHQVGNLYGLRNWVEYGLKQSKNELGWADFRLTNYTDIEKWWELVVGFNRLIAFMNRFPGAIPTAQQQTDFHFSSA